MSILRHKFLKKYTPPLIIAELGLNHNGSVNLAKKSIRAAKLAGADVVKLQTFKTESLCSAKSKYFKFFKSCELNKKQLINIFNFASEEKIPIFSTVLDQWSADIISDFNPPFIKIASGDITHIPLIKYIAKKNIPIILSTGASNIDEIREAIKSIRNTNKKLPYHLLHCISNYPTNPEETNMLCMKTMKQKFRVPIGFSDHTTSNEASLVAVTLGAEIIEKHFTLDKKLKGPDHALSADPKEFAALVKSLKIVNKIKGQPKKELVEGKKIVFLIRRSLFATRTIKAGEKIKIDDINISRPAKGIQPKFINKVIGKKPTKTIKKNSPITWNCFNKL